MAPPPRQPPRITSRPTAGPSSTRPAYHPPPSTRRRAPAAERPPKTPPGALPIPLLYIIPRRMPPPRARNTAPPPRHLPLTPTPRPRHPGAPLPHPDAVPCPAPALLFLPSHRQPPHAPANTLRSALPRDKRPLLPHSGLRFPTRNRHPSPPYYRGGVTFYRFSIRNNCFSKFNSYICPVSVPDRHEPGRSSR